MLSNIDTRKQVCSRCVMDTSAADIYFDSLGHCNYCTEFAKSLHDDSHPRSQKDNLNFLLEEIRSQGRGKSYDCIIGVSGGVDSTFALFKAKELGLRPLAVHLDNGWNSELANRNIHNIVSTLHVDLITHVVDWEEFRDLQTSFLKANVIDIELLTDNALLALNFKSAKKFGTKFILSGSNHSTEGMRMPRNWNHFKFDAANIKAIQREFGTQKVKTLPTMGTLEFTRYKILHKIKWVSFLDYFDYNKSKSMELLQDRFNFQPYPYKHYESIFTRFYQGLILPKKFGVDKRRLHLSNLIMSKQLTRAEALNHLEDLPYPSQAALESDLEYFLKKMKMSSLEFQNYLIEPRVSHTKFQSEINLFNLLMKINHFLK